jgi:hypothetical protein
MDQEVLEDQVTDYIQQKIEERKRLKDLDRLSPEQEAEFRYAIGSHAMDHGIEISEGEEFDYLQLQQQQQQNMTTTSSGIELSPQPIYQEHVRDVSETLINQTHAQLVVEGNGTLTLPNSTETIRTTSTGSGIVSIFSTFAGKEILTTEDGSENATAISYEIARSNKEEGIGKGIAIAIIHTNSTGRLAPLDGMILVGQEEFQPDGRALITYWEWQQRLQISRHSRG